MDNLIGMLLMIKKENLNLISPISIFVMLLIMNCSLSADAKTFKAVTTFTVIADMARNVAGDAAIVESITLSLIHI